MDIIKGHFGKMKIYNMKLEALNGTFNERNENNGRIITFPATPQMLKRESCNHTKHDSSFSQWKVLRINYSLNY